MIFRNLSSVPSHLSNIGRLFHTGDHSDIGAHYEWKIDSLPLYIEKLPHIPHNATKVYTSQKKKRRYQIFIFIWLLLEHVYKS